MTNPSPLALANIDSVHIVKSPTGRYYLAGCFPAALGLEQPDGSDVTPEQAACAAQCGPRIAGVRTRTWPTREAAVEALRAWGWQGE